MLLVKFRIVVLPQVCMKKGCKPFKFQHIKCANNISNTSELQNKKLFEVYRYDKYKKHPNMYNTLNDSGKVTLF